MIREILPPIFLVAIQTGADLCGFQLIIFIIQSIRKYGEFYGDDLLVECPAGSGNKMNLKQVADELQKGLLAYLKKMTEGKRNIYGKYNWFYQATGQ